MTSYKHNVSLVHLGVGIFNSSAQLSGVGIFRCHQSSDVAELLPQDRNVLVCWLVNPAILVTVRD